MQAVYLTIAAIVLYFGSDWILNRIEIARGKRFEHRNIIFFFIILLLALISFNLLGHLEG